MLELLLDSTASTMYRAILVTERCDAWASKWGAVPFPAPAGRLVTWSCGGRDDTRGQESKICVAFSDRDGKMGSIRRRPSGRCPFGKAGAHDIVLAAGRVTQQSWFRFSSSCGVDLQPAGGCMQCKPAEASATYIV
jgi:hypothetical protein